MADDSKTKCADSPTKEPSTASGKKPKWYERLRDAVGTAIGNAMDQR